LPRPDQLAVGRELANFKLYIPDEFGDWQAFEKQGYHAQD
jgi:hypothetical protein